MTSDSLKENESILVFNEVKSLIKINGNDKKESTTAKAKLNKSINVSNKTKGKSCQNKGDRCEEIIDHSIQLNLKNMVNGTLVNKQGVLCLIDSGASVSVISQGIINKSQYLQSIETATCKPIVINIKPL